VASALDDLEPVLPGQFARRGVELLDGEDDVVELERYDAPLG
jgi:hypothetical protein